MLNGLALVLTHSILVFKLFEIGRSSVGRRSVVGRSSVGCRSVGLAKFLASVGDGGNSAGQRLMANNQQKGKGGQLVIDTNIEMV